MGKMADKSAIHHRRGGYTDVAKSQSLIGASFTAVGEGAVAWFLLTYLIGDMESIKTL